MLDMTKGKPFKLMIFFAIPLLVSSILQQLYNICDTIMVGQMIGIKALAAIGASFPIFFSTIVINIGFTQGLTVITAQSFGAKDFTKMRRSVATSSFLATAFSLLCNLLLYLSLDNILHITKVPPEIIGMSKSYLTIITSFGVIISTYNLLAGFLRAIGDSKTPLYFLIFSSICNIGLNYVFIKYAKLGIRGSAYGTILAIFVTLILCLIYIVKRYPMLKPRANEWKINYNFCKEHLYIALPMALQFSIIVLSLSIVQTACNSLGYEAIAGLTAAIRIEQLTGNFLSSLGVAVTTFVAQNYGANMMGRVKKGVIQASQISFITSVILSLITFAFSKNLIMLFLKQEDSSIVSNVLDLSSTYLNLVILFYFFLGQIFIFRGACQGMGNSFITLLSSILELVTRALAITFLVDRLGFLGLSLSAPVAWVSGAAVLFWGYLWKLKQIKIKKLKNRKISIDKHQSILYKTSR